MNCPLMHYMPTSSASAAFCAANDFSFACIYPIIYALSAKALQANAFSRGGLVHRNVFGGCRLINHT